ncbi:MAG: cell division protein SepF [Lactobacillus sp.]|nr:cell division protein SepF [Lactobacillus sp.]
MALQNKLSRFFGLDDETEEYEEPEVNVEDQASNNSKMINIDKARNSSLANQTSEITLYEPRVFSDAKEVGDKLLDNQAVIVNFSRMDDESARRIVDFLTGTVYALDGEIQRVGDKIFLVTPPKFQTTGTISDLVDKSDSIN